jgi:hypothetical protein
LKFQPYFASFPFASILPLPFVLSPICPLGHLHPGDWPDVPVPAAPSSLRGLPSAQTFFPLLELLDWLSHGAGAKPSSNVEFPHEASFRQRFCVAAIKIARRFA